MYHYQYVGHIYNMLAVWDTSLHYPNDWQFSLRLMRLGLSHQGKLSKLKIMIIIG